jgi:DNA-binding NtrC family response regulator
MRIVFADGHDNFRGVVVGLLRDAGHEVHAAAHGGELVAVVRRVAPDVIVTHVRFADLTAIDALELLASANVRVPTILMSGEMHALPHAEAARLGVVTYLEKPFPMTALHEALESVTRAPSVDIAS